MSGFRILARRIAYRSGALGYARARRPDALTVVMFHRVIDRTDPDFATADPDYAVEASLFDELLGFFLDHYHVVSLADVMDAVDQRRRLPDHPLLITFDDGWADNLRYAAPLLERRGLPAVIFVVAEALLSPANSWWQEEIFTAARQNNLAEFEKMMFEAGRSGANVDDPDEYLLDLVCRAAEIPEGERAPFLDSIGFPPRSSRMMLAPADLAKVGAARIAIGNHGYTHLPLTRIDDPETDVRKSAAAIAELTGDGISAGALSCPHGRYDASVIRSAQAAGARLIFTSDPILNSLASGLLLSGCPIGRIPISAASIVDRSGRLDRSALATWLWRRPFGSTKRADA